MKMSSIFHVFIIWLVTSSLFINTLVLAVSEEYEDVLERYARHTKVISGGRNSSNRVFIQVGNHVFFDNIPHSRETAGLYAVGILDDKVLLQSQYSMFADGQASNKLARDIEKLPQNTFVVVAAKDEPTRNFNQIAQDALYIIGAEKGLLNSEPRSSYLCLGIKGLEKGEAIEKVGMQELRYAGTEVGKRIDFTFPAKPQNILFSDPSLESCIRNALQIFTPTDITTTDILTLTSLQARGKNIRTLTGIEYATNLQTLNLRDNQVSDISPLSKLINLKDLNFQGNNISDISHLSGLTNLTTLTVYRNHRITDISPISGLTNLTTLSIGYNKITDISPLSKLTKLEVLSIRDNNIKDISPISRLVRLKDLTMWHNVVEDFSPISNLVNLKKLIVGDNKCPDISPFKNLKKLKHLDASQNKLSDISSLAGLSDLTYLDIRASEVEYIKPLANLTNLKYLNIEHNNIRDISPLCGLINLDWLSVRDNQISDISPLKKLTKLQILSCRDNQISDISAIRDMSKMVELDLQGNQIHDIFPLAKMTKLKTLVLWDNNIENILPLMKLMDLEILDIGRNRINSLSAIFQLTQLTRLKLKGNKIRDIRAIGRLENLSFLDISGNPIDRSSYRIGILKILINNPGCELLSDKVNTQTLQNSFSTHAIDSRKIVFIVASSDFNDKELFETKAAFEKANVQSVIASTKKGTIKGMLGGTAKAEILLEGVVVDDYDVVVFVGGSGAREFFDNQTALEIARQTARKKRILAAICVAPMVLANAGVLNGLKATSALSEKNNLEKAGVEYTGVAVEQDKLIITGNGPTAVSQFSKAILNTLLIRHD